MGSDWDSSRRCWWVLTLMLMLTAKSVTTVALKAMMSATRRRRGGGLQGGVAWMTGPHGSRDQLRPSSQAILAVLRGTPTTTKADLH